MIFWVWIGSLSTSAGTCAGDLKSAQVVMRCSLELLASWPMPALGSYVAGCRVAMAGEVVRGKDKGSGEMENGVEGLVEVVICPSMDGDE